MASEGKTLDDIEEFWNAKRHTTVTIKVREIGSAPRLSLQTFGVPGTWTFQQVYNLLKEKCAAASGTKDGVGAQRTNSTHTGQDVNRHRPQRANTERSRRGDQSSAAHKNDFFVYCNDSFEPSKAEYIADLFECFKTGDRLILSYSIEPAFA